MQTKNNRTQLSMCALLIASLLLLAGCMVSNQKGKNGDENNVELRTPIGALKVRSNIDPKETGLTVYPNARIKPSEDSDKDKSANVNISTPMFALKVVAMDYLSDDPPQKVLDFYKKDMARYGKVIECKGMNGDVHTHDNGEMKLTLTCDSGSNSDHDIELKAGEGSSQHVVGVSPNGKGTEFGLVYIQMRGKAETM